MIYINKNKYDRVLSIFCINFLILFKDDLITFHVNKFTRRQIMLNLKVTFPRLKTFSERSITQTRTTNSGPNTLNIINTVSNIHQNIQNFQQRINSLKLQYINKSPHYFKMKNRSAESFRQYQQSLQTIEEYVGQHSRLLDKQMLLELAKKRAQKHRKQEFRKQNKFKYQYQEQSGNGSPFDEPRQNRQIESMKQSKYENFRPLRVPLKHNIKYVLQHPDLRVKANIN